MLRQALTRSFRTLVSGQAWSYAAPAASGARELSGGSSALFATALPTAMTCPSQLFQTTLPIGLFVGRQRQLSPLRTVSDLLFGRYFSAAATARVAGPAKATQPKSAAAANATDGLPKGEAKIRKRTAASANAGKASPAAKRKKPSAIKEATSSSAAEKLAAEEAAPTRPRRRAATGSTISARTTAAEKRQRAKERERAKAARARAKLKEQVVKAKERAKLKEQSLKAKERAMAKALRERAKAQEAQMKEKVREAKEKQRQEALAAEAARIKRAPSAYFLFFKEHIKRGPDAPKTTREEHRARQLALAQRFKALSPEERRPYDEAAAKAKAEVAKLRAERKEATRAKKVDSAYIIFCKETLPKLKAESPDTKPRELIIRCGEMWRAMSAEAKQKYVEVSEADARAKGLAPLGAKKAAAVVRPGPEGSNAAEAVPEGSKPVQGEVHPGPEGSKAAEAVPAESKPVQGEAAWSKL